MRNIQQKVFQFSSSWSHGDLRPRLDMVEFCGEKSGSITLEYNGKRFSFMVSKNLVKRIKREFSDNLR